MKQTENMTYKDAGVDIDAGNELVEVIKPLAKATARKGSSPDLGGFGALFDLSKLDYDDPVLVAGTDGVGTKLEIANTINKHDTIGIDLVAMVVNDLVVQGAEPLFFLDYFATGKLDIEQAKDVITGIAEGCKQAGCALIGGETAEMPGLYKVGDYDLAGFGIGAVERSEILPKDNIKDSDIIIGLHSSGVHSNGFSLVRHIIKETSVSYAGTNEALGKSLGETLLEPTKIYVKSCMSLMKNSEIKAFAHITGGGLTENIPRVLSDDIAAEIDCTSWKMPPIFKWLMEHGNIAPSEMLRTFNCGIGMIVVIPKEAVADVQAILAESGEDFSIIGKIISRNGGDDGVIYSDMEAICG